LIKTVEEINFPVFLKFNLLFIRYIYYGNLQLLNNVNNNKAKVLLPQA